jgi:hypothetical protein
VSGLPADESDILVEQKTTNNGSLAMRIIVRKRVQGHNFEVVHIICKDDDPTNWDTNTNELVRPNGSDLTVIRERNGDYDLSEADDTESSEGTYDGNDNVGEDATQWIEADGTEKSEDMYDGNDKVGDPTQWVSINPDMCTRDGREYKTTTQSTQDNDANTGHHKPRARRKSWDAGPPSADTDAKDTCRAIGQLTEDIDAAKTHSTHTPHPHVTHTYKQDARKAAEGPVHPLTPIPHQTQIIPPSPIPLTRAAESAAPAVSEPLTLAGNTLKHIDAQRVCTHTSTPEADFSNASVGKGP